MCIERVYDERYSLNVHNLSVYDERYTWMIGMILYLCLYLYLYLHLYFYFLCVYDERCSMSLRVYDERRRGMIRQFATASPHQQIQNEWGWGDNINIRELLGY